MPGMYGLKRGQINLAKGGIGASYSEGGSGCFWLGVVVWGTPSVWALLASAMGPAEKELFFKRLFAMKVPKVAWPEKCTGA